MSISSTGQQANLWVGRAGLVTSLHYDAAYNFFVQIRGSKRFRLIPPSTPLFEYPCVHPHMGHAQVNISDPLSLKRFNIAPSDLSEVKSVGFLLHFTLGAGCR
jgi:hypothetical protein